MRPHCNRNLQEKYRTCLKLFGYIKDRIGNTIVSLELENMEGFWNQWQAWDLPAKYKAARLTPGRNQAWRHRKLPARPIRRTLALCPQMLSAVVGFNYAYM